MPVEMNEKQGYKYTEEFGYIPEDWKVKILRDLITFRNGVAHEDDVSSNGKYILINSKFISSNGTVKKYVNEFRCPLNKSEIVIVLSDIPNGKALAKCYYIDKENIYTLNQRIGSIKVLEGNCSSYIYRALNRNKYLLSYNDGITQTNLRNEDVLSCPILLPPLNEQEKIAEVLGDIDGLIDKTQQLINKKKDLKTATMQKLLTPKPDWETKELGQLLQYEQPTKYIVKNTEYNNNNTIPVLTAGKSFILGYTDETDNLFDKLPVIIFDDFTTESKFVTFPFKVKSSAMKILKPIDINTNIKLVHEIMQNIEFHISDHKRYWISEYQYIKIKIPLSKDEQTKIATILSDIDAEIEALEEELNKYQDLKTGMMQDLLTGKVRLK